MALRVPFTGPLAVSVPDLGRVFAPGETYDMTDLEYALMENSGLFGPPEPSPSPEPSPEPALEPTPDAPAPEPAPEGGA